MNEIREVSENNQSLQSAGYPAAVYSTGCPTENKVYDSFLINQNNFSGPIDLLLHLVKKRELEITEMALAEVCDQYLEYVNTVKALDLDLASEYLVIAATLVSIKASLILNQPVELEEDEDGNLFDPHMELLLRLKEAEVYKQAAKKISEDQPILGLDVYARESSLHKFKATDAGIADHESYLLVKAFNQVLKRIKDREVYEVALESVSIVDSMTRVMDCLTSRLASGKSSSFMELLNENYSKAQIVGTLLALLELCKRQILKVSQDLESEEIQISLANQSQEPSKEDLANFYSEYDQKVVA